MRREFYLYSAKARGIINCVSTTSLDRAKQVVATMQDPDDISIMENPPRYLLERYRYWNERP